MVRVRGVLAVVLTMLATAFAGEITYDAGKKWIWVKGFPEENPATMDDVLKADEAGKWSVLNYDRASDTYTVRASLLVGTDKDTGTYFQIGRKGHEKETVVLQGNFWVLTAKDSAKRPDGRFSIVNRLRMGDPRDTSIRPSLKFDCSSRGEFGLFAGYRKGAAVLDRCIVEAYRAAITAATRDRDHAFGGKPDAETGMSAMYASSIRLVETEFSWFTGNPLYSWSTPYLEGCVIADGETALQGGNKSASRTVFRNLRTAVSASSVRMTECTFEDNDVNFHVGGSGWDTGVELVDCTVGSQKKPVYLAKNNCAPEEAVRRKIPVYPAYAEWISLPVRVVGANGKPLSMATVDVTCAQDPEAVRNGFSLTDEKGLTADDAGTGILILKKKLLATDNPQQPKESVYTFTVTVQAEGRKETTVSLNGAEAIPRPLQVQIK